MLQDILIHEWLNSSKIEQINNTFNNILITTTTESMEKQRPSSGVTEGVSANSTRVRIANNFHFHAID